MQVFDSMKQAAATDPDCTPNTITYSSLISACAAGARLDKALQVGALTACYMPTLKHSLSLTT